MKLTAIILTALLVSCAKLEPVGNLTIVVKTNLPDVEFFTYNLNGSPCTADSMVDRRETYQGLNHITNLQLMCRDRGCVGYLVPGIEFTVTDCPIYTLEISINKP